MSFRAMGLRRSLGVVLLVTLAGAAAAFAQMARPPVAALAQARIGQDDAVPTPLRVINFANEQAITTTFVQAPQLGSTGGAVSGDNSNWLKVEFHYGVNPPNPKYPWVDSADFKVWIEGRDLYDPKAPPGSLDGVAVCLTGAVTYVNLQQGADAYGVFYVHPTALARYCGNGTYEDFDRKFDVRVTASVGGKVVDQYDKNKDYSDWNVKCVQVPNMVLRQNQSPFVLADPTRYPQIKLPTSEPGSSQ